MKSKGIRMVVVALVLWLACPAARAGWFDENFLPINIDFNKGEVTLNVPTPQQIPQRIQHAVETAPRALEGGIRDLFNPAGATLAMAIHHAQEQARHGAQPIPANIRGQLAGIVSDRILNDVSWNSLDKNRIDLANLTLLHNDNAAAITVGNVIVFDRLEDANSNIWLWGHELMHVIQYSGMGIELFAHTYITSRDTLENQGDSHGDMVQRAVDARREGQQFQPIQLRQNTMVTDSAGYFRTLQSAVKQYAPATGCLDIDDDESNPKVTNVCNTPVWVISYVEVNRRTGRRFAGRCTHNPPYITCSIGPGQTLPIITPNRGCQAEVRFSFFSDGGGSQEGIWKGDCSEYENLDDDDDVIDNTQEEQMGSSCCMFQGGRCGPFTNQPPNPIGLSCSCQHGNPYADGRVCKP